MFVHISRRGQPLGDAATDLFPDAGSVLNPDTPIPDTTAQETPAASDGPAWWDLWGKLKAASDDLDAAIAKLESQRAYAMTRPELAQQVIEREAELQTAKARVAWVRDAIKSVLGFFGIQLSGLGFLPLIPIAVAAAAVAYIAKQAADTWALSKKIEEQQRLEAKGVSPTTASRIVQSEVNAGSITQTITSARGLVVALSVAGGLFVAYKVAKRLGYL